MIDRPKDEQGRFVSQNSETLADKPLSVRISNLVDAKLRTLPVQEKTNWLRRIIANAAYWDYMSDAPEAQNYPIVLTLSGLSPSTRKALRSLSSETIEQWLVERMTQEGLTSD